MKWPIGGVNTQTSFCSVSQKEKRNGRYLSQIVTLFSNLLFR